MSGHTETTRCGTRWRRAALINLAGVIILAWFISQMWTGRVLGLGGGLVIQGQKAQFNSAQLNATDVAFAIVPIQLRSGTSGTTNQNVLRFGLAAGKLDGFCISQSKSFLGVDYTLRLTSRNGALGSFDVVGKNLQFDVTTTTSTTSPASGDGIQLKGNVALGVTSQSVSTWMNAAGTQLEDNPLDGPGNYTGVNGRLFGVNSSNADLYNLKGDIYDAIIEGPININNLKVEVVPGNAAAEGCKNIPIVY